MVGDASITVEVAYARPDEQRIIELQVPPGTTVGEAIERSGITELFPEIDLARNKVGIFGKLGKLDAVLQPGDRVEIYRPLIADPKEARKKRAAEGKVMRKGARAANAAREKAAGDKPGPEES
ncbi:MAG: RnfH family protein [Gammaproteobacteria bacterium]|nr:MAG: RnfH family protein [Gammaproteobacteria bacterium]